MEKGNRESLFIVSERAVLLGIISDSFELENPLTELAKLAKTAGAEIVAKITQKRLKPEPGKYVGKGKLEELKKVCTDLKADVIICEDDLTPSQLRHIEEFTCLKVIDRTELILDIFALRASTRQAQLQVELAQAEYSLPRLKRMWKHLSRIAGGIGVRGPGEKQIESDRRQIQKRITELKKQLAKIEKQKEREVEHRNASHYTIATIGYTNAGKSTLMNRLTEADILVEDRLFSTIGTKTKNFKIGNWKFLLSDTVGFIRKLPHHLVASFQATLEEAKQAQLLLHVVDASHPEVDVQIDAVDKVLESLGMSEKPTLIVFNKMDQVKDHSLIPLEKYPNAVQISAKDGAGLEQFKEKIVEHFSEKRELFEFTLDPQYGKILSFLHDKGEIIKSYPQEDKMYYQVHFDKRDSGWLKTILIQTKISFETSPLNEATFTTNS